MFCISRKRVLRAKHSHTGLERLLVHLEGLWKLSLSSQNTSNNVLGVGHDWVVVAKRFFAGLEALAVHFKRLWVLALISEHGPDVVLGSGCVWVLQAKCLNLELKHVLPHGQCICIFAKLCIYDRHAAKKQKK